MHNRLQDPPDIETLDDQSAAFAATIAHALRLHEKAEMLRTQSREAMVVATGFVGRGQVDHDVIRAAAAALHAATVPGRGLITIAARGIQTPPGQHVVRKRSDLDRWPKAPAWVYALKDQQGSVIYIGATEHVSSRVKHHKEKPWTHVVLIACASRREAMTLEGDLIFHHQPPLNRADTQRRRYVK